MRNINERKHCDANHVIDDLLKKRLPLIKLYKLQTKEKDHYIRPTEFHFQNSIHEVALLKTNRLGVFGGNSLRMLGLESARTAFLS